MIEVVPGLYRLEEDDDGRALCQFVIRGSTRTLVVDTGLPATPTVSLLPFLEELGVESDPLVLLTHPDADHCGGTSTLLAALPGAEILAFHPDSRLLGDPERTIAERYQPYAESDAIRIPKGSLERMRGRFGGRYRITRSLTGEETLDLGDRQCELLVLPGHSPGHGGVWLSDCGVLVAGDAVMATGIRKRDGALLYAPQFFSPSTYRLTIRRIARMNAQLLLCAHEPPRTAAQAHAFLALSLQAVDDLERLVMVALQQGPRPLAEVCSDVHAQYGGLPSGRSHDLATTVAGILAERTGTGHVAFDERESPRQFSLVTA